ncbi:hypothetical protein C0J52_25438 [Blattella germanica]|nr:hypothetical protein C0J52_25438 [Blattella germanica]
MLKGSNYKLDNDYDYNTRQIRKKLLPFMHEARGKGHRANIINDKLKINGKIYDLDHLENGFRNAENLEQIHNRRHSFRADLFPPFVITMILQIGYSEEEDSQAPNEEDKKRKYSNSITENQGHLQPEHQQTME